MIQISKCAKNSVARDARKHADIGAGDVEWNSSIKDSIFQFNTSTIKEKRMTIAVVILA